MKSEGLDLRVLLLCFCCVQCVQFSFTFQPLPEAAEFAKVRPGVTTRSEVLDLLGPPEEYRRLSAPEFARVSSPQRRMILDGGRVFDRDTFTYACGHRHTRVVGLFPVGPYLAKRRVSQHAEERWQIFFDKDDVVEAISHVDEREPQ